ncbi:MAG TPA: phosphotransferase [Acidimicrobiales bacterium]
MIDLPTAERLASATLHSHSQSSEAPIVVGPWSIAKVASGFNGVVWRARAIGASDIAIKLSAIDPRERASREFESTQRLYESGLDIAPRPLVVVREPEGSAIVSTWCPGVSLDSPPDELAFWSRVATTYAKVHSTSPKGLRIAVDGFTISNYLDKAKTYADRAGRHRFSVLLEKVRNTVGDALPVATTKALIHGDVSIANMLVSDDEIRLVDWEYSGAGDPCWDLAGLCTTPAHLDLPVEVMDFVIRQHASEIGFPDLAIRTRALVIVALTIWCARESSTPMFARLPGAEGIPRFDAATRSNLYRQRLAGALDVDRRDVDRVLDA